MAKLRGPLLSFRARGQIGKTLVMSSWRGVSYARQYVEPAYTNTTGQSNVRSTFSWLNAHYARLGSIALLPWDLATISRARTGRNQMIAVNLDLLFEDVTITDFVASGGARGGPAPDDFTAAPGGASGEIDVEIVPPIPPTGWLVLSASFSLIHQQNPREAYLGMPTEAEMINPGPYEYTFAGLTPADSYLASGWVVYQRPDATQAVSVSGSALIVATP